MCHVIYCVLNLHTPKLFITFKENEYGMKGSKFIPFFVSISIIKSGKGVGKAHVNN